MKYRTDLLKMAIMALVVVLSPFLFSACSLSSKSDDDKALVARWVGSRFPDMSSLPCQLKGENVEKGNFGC